MEESKVGAIFQWVQLLIGDRKIDSIECFHNVELPLEILKLVDKDIWTDEFRNDPSGRLECILSYLEGFYCGLRNSIDTTAILAKNHFETVKLLVVILVAAVNSENAPNFVKPIMTLSREAQINIMSIISPINEKMSEQDLAGLLCEVLCNAVTGEELHLVKSPSSFIFSPGAVPQSPYSSFVGSPAVNFIRNASHCSSIDVDSPFKLMVSPKICSRKELFEKNKLNVRLKRLQSNVTTQSHIIDELEQKLEESRKKNEFLENINGELKSRVKGMSPLQDEIDSLKMVRTELETKEDEIKRISERLSKTLGENSLLTAEINMLQQRLESAKIATVAKMRGIKDDHDKLRSNGDALKVKNAELLNNIYIREEKFRQISDEKDNQCKELLDHVALLKEQLAAFEKRSENEAIEENQLCLKNEMQIVDLEKDLKKANDELILTKEKCDTSSKLIFELQNQISENQSVIDSTRDEIEAKNESLLDLQKELDCEIQLARERESKIKSEFMALQSVNGKLEGQVIALQDEKYVLKREKEEILVSINRKKEDLERLLHEQQVKVRSVEMHVSNLMTENDHLKQASKEKCNEFAQKIEEMEENHNAGCCRLKETYEKKICDLEQISSNKSEQLNGLQESYTSLLNAKRVEDGIFVSRISALIEEREDAVGTLKAEMNEKIDDMNEEKLKLEAAFEEVSKKKGDVENENSLLRKDLVHCENELKEVRQMHESVVFQNQEKSSSIAILENKVKHCKDEFSELSEAKKASEIELEEWRHKVDDIHDQAQTMEAEYKEEVELISVKCAKIESENARLMNEIEQVRNQREEDLIELASREEEVRALKSDHEEAILLKCKSFDDMKKCLQESLHKAETEVAEKEKSELALKQEFLIKFAAKEKEFEEFVKVQSHEKKLFQEAHEKLNGELTMFTKDSQSKQNEIAHLISNIEDFQIKNEANAAKLKGEYEENESAWVKEKERLENQIECEMEKKHEELHQIALEKREILQEKEELIHQQQCLRNEFEKAKEDIVKAEAMLVEERRANEVLEVDIERLRLRSLEELSEIKEKCEKEKEELRATRDSTQHEFQSLKNEMQEVTCQLQAKKDTVSSLRRSMIKILNRTRADEEITQETELDVGKVLIDSKVGGMVCPDSEVGSPISALEGEIPTLNTAFEYEIAELLSIEEKLKDAMDEKEAAICRATELAEKDEMLSDSQKVVETMLVEKELLFSELDSVRLAMDHVTRKNEGLLSSLVKKDEEQEELVKSHTFEMKGLLEENENLCHKIESMKEEGNVKDSEIEAKIEELQKVSADLMIDRTARDEMAEKLAVCEKENADMKCNLDRVEVELDELRLISDDTVASMKGQVYKSEQEIESLVKEVASLKEQNGTKDTAVKESIGENEDLANQLKVSKETLNERNRVIEQNRKSMEELTTEVESLQKEIENKDEINQCVEKELKSVSEKLTDLNEENVKTVDLYNVCKIELQATKDELFKVTNKNESLLDDLDAVKTSFEQEKKLLFESLQNEKATTQTYVEEIEGMKSNISELHAENVDLKTESVQYEKEVNELRENLKYQEGQKLQHEKTEIEFQHEREKLHAELDIAKQSWQKAEAKIEFLIADTKESNMQQELKWKSNCEATVNKINEESGLKIKKLQHDIAASEMEVEKIKSQSREIIDELQQKLKGKSHDCNRIEAEKIECQSRLNEIEGSVQVFEKKTDMMKKKMRTDMLQLMKDYEEKEKAFEEERQYLKSNADGARKTLLETKQNLEDYKVKVDLLEAKLEYKSSNFGQESVPNQGSLQPSNGINITSASSSLVILKQERDSTQPRSTHRQSILLSNALTPGEVTETSFDDQSTLVCDEITVKKSPSLRSLDFNSEENFGGSITSLESVASTDSNFSRVTNFSRQSCILGSRPRRRSLLYMAGRTPPERRTTLSVPMPQIPACQMEDEPDILESKGFGDDFYRIDELKRRNTLCLPHLKSSYPLELLSTKTTKGVQDSEYEDSLRHSINQGRKRPSDEGKFLAPPKRKANATATGYLKKDPINRSVKSDSNIMTRSMVNDGSRMVWGDESRFNDESQSETAIDPRRESIAFSIDFDEPKKKLKTRASLRRSRGSAHLFPAESKESVSSSRNDVSKKVPVANTRVTKPKMSALDAKGKENKAPSKSARSSLTPRQADKASLKSRTTNFRKSVRRSISKMRGTKHAV